MGRARTIARRSFLIGSAAILGGVAFGAYFVTRPTPNPLLDGLAEGEAALTPFVKITPQGITLIVPRADVGQGIASTQAMLIAEELDIDPATATLDPGQPHQAYFNATVAAESLPFPGWEQGFVAEHGARPDGLRRAADGFAVHRRIVVHRRPARDLAPGRRYRPRNAQGRRCGAHGRAAADLRTEDGHVVLP
jgi:isoquinoline 1-oxidoreductase beta subunit